MGKWHVGFTTAASTSRQEDVSAHATPPPQPPRQAKHILSMQTYSSIATTTKQRLCDLDSGRCLITFEKMPNASQQVAHIVAHKTSGPVVKKIEKMWQMSLLNLDLTKNLVTLRADWHLVYDHAFVPAEHILRRILKYKATNFNEPYPGFDQDESQTYVFVPLPTLRRCYILRQIGEEGEDEQDMVDIEGGKATIYIKLFFEFPLLEHHGHPFCIIYNALPKLQKYGLQLCPEHHVLLTLINKIKTIWMEWLMKVPSSSNPKKRRKPSNGSPSGGGGGRNDDDDDTHDGRPKCKPRMAAPRRRSQLHDADRTETRETHSGAYIGKGKGKARGLSETMAAQPQESRYPTPSPTSQSSTVKVLGAKVFLYDDISEVAAWAAAIATAGPLEVTNEVVVWSDEEPQPKQWARFCSSDWPMYLYSFLLWMPSYK
ncbi:hypothetical protein L208DRAFT_1393806 [Tricholoma matsutake]|nr:hypothetical protein L208DRAFT_1393806 [Tricholoma matsutake 945]